MIAAVAVFEIPKNAHEDVSEVAWSQDGDFSDMGDVFVISE